MREWKIYDAQWYAARNCGYAQMEDLGCAVVCREELWLCANGRFRMRSGMPRGIVVMREWEDLGCAVIWRKELWLCGNR